MKPANWSFHSETASNIIPYSILQYAAIKLINEPNRRGLTLLVLVIWNGHVPVAEMLLEKVPDIDFDQSNKGILCSTILKKDACSISSNRFFSEQRCE